jgi:hypothetical protein
MRRVVTEHTADRKAIFASDNDIEERIVRVPSGEEMFRVCPVCTMPINRKANFQYYIKRSHTNGKPSKNVI